MTGVPPPSQDSSSPQQQQQQGQLQLPITPALRSFPYELDIATALSVKPPEQAQADPLLSDQLGARRATLEAPAPIMLAPQHATSASSGVETPLPPSAPASTTSFADDFSHDSTKIYANGLDSSPLTSHTIHEISHSSHDPLGGGGSVTVDHSADPIGEGTPVRLEFLLLSGKRMRLSIGDKTSIQRTREIVWQRWPPEWSGPEKLPPSTQSLRLLYLGKVLEDDKTLSTYGIGSLEGANPTVVHLNVRPLSLSRSEWSLAVKKEDQSDGCWGCIIG